jgi:hypothetical protein
MKLVACWHHGDMDRLKWHLRYNRIDLYGPREFTKKGINRLDYWWNHRMRLKRDDRIQIGVKGEIVATATIAGPPEEFAEGQDPWQSIVPLKDIELFDPPKPARCVHLQGSHRFDGPKTASLVTLSDC